MRDALIDWAIFGHETGFRRRRFVRFAGGRSRRKLEWIALRMNRSGEYQVTVCRIRVVRAAMEKKNA